MCSRVNFDIKVLLAKCDCSKRFYSEEAIQYTHMDGAPLRVACKCSAVRIHKPLSVLQALNRRIYII